MEERPVETTAVAEPVDDLGFGGRFINIFTNPRKAFESINNKPTWFWALFIVIIAVIAFTQINYPIMIHEQLADLRDRLEPEQFEAQAGWITGNPAVHRAIVSGSQLIFMPIIYLLFTAIFYFVGSVILGGDSTFKKVLAVWSWSSIIGILGMIVKTPLVMIKESFKVTLSPSLILSGDMVDTSLFRVLSNFDFFMIWSLAVFAIGYGVIYKFSTAKSFTAVGVLWGIWIVISTVFANVFSSFGM